MSTFIATQTFEELRDSEVLPAPSGVRLTIMQLCQKEDLALAELVSQVQGDPILAGRLIQIANIPNVNKGRMIASVNIDMLLMIGLHAVRQMALAISLTETGRRGDCKEFDYDKFWARSSAMACAGQALAEMLTIVPPAEMFTVGLLAGIGKLGIASSKPKRYGELLAQNPPPEALAGSEQEMFGFNHLALAAAMMEDWHFPGLFCNAVLYHEAPEASGFDEEDRQQRLIRMLEMAACVADICTAPDAEARRPFLIQMLLLCRRFDLGAQAVEHICSKTSRDWMGWGSLLKVKTHTLQSVHDELNAVVEAVG